VEVNKGKGDSSRNKIRRGGIFGRVIGADIVRPSGGLD
jgi:hypothetical protein